MSLLALLDVVVDIVPALTQALTNGPSLLGTLQASTFALFLSGNGNPPWGSSTVFNTNPYTQMPSASVTRSYTFNVGQKYLAPDGYNQSMIVVNGQFPGPTIEANWGDTIQVTVNNNLAEGTGMHWHGILHKASQWTDGVPGITSTPIPPGDSYTYSFKADLYGTSWYHSHYSAQYAGGIWGPMIIHGPTNVPYDVDLGPIPLNDFYHRDYHSVVQDVMGTDLSKIRPASDNNLIAGKMNFDCSSVTDGTKCTNDAGLAKFKVASGKTYRMRLINTSAQAIQKFSIDNHTMTVMANDFVPIKPYNTTVVTLGVGQRTDVVVKGTGNSSGAYWIRSTIPTQSCTEPANQPYALAVLYYQNANSSATPNTTAQVDNTNPCANDPLSSTVPEYTINATNAPAMELDVSFTINSTGHFLWLMKNESFRINYNDPLLLLAKQGNTSFPLDPQWNTIVLNSTSVVRVYIDNQTPVSHPMHLHGHNMQILAEGAGTWDGTTVNLNNPQRRDVQIMQAGGYMVAQWNLDNPGVWPLHCHIAWHVSGGLQVNFIERPADIKNIPIPPPIYKLYNDWYTYTNATTVNQIDSGL